MFGDTFRDAKVLITGHTGFKGSWLTAWLLKLGAKVVGVSSGRPTDPALFDILDIEEKISSYREDIRNNKQIKDRVTREKPDFVFHLAAQPIVSLAHADPLGTLSANVMGTANVLDALRYVEHPCTAVIITSDKCYNNVEWSWGYRETDHLGGKDIYGGSKAAAEIVFHSYFNSFFKDSPCVRVATARAGNVLGGGDWAEGRIVPDCVRAWAKGEDAVIRNPNAVRPWQHVLEPLSGYLTLAQALSNSNGNSLNGESFNFGPPTEQCHAVWELVQDIGLTWPGSKARFSEAIETPFHESNLLQLNCDKARRLLGWKPTFTYPQMVEAVGNWYYAYHNGADMKAVTLVQTDRYEILWRGK